MKVAVTIGNDKRVKPYLDALDAVGLQHEVFTPDDKVGAKTLEAFAGLLLCGGGDIDPGLYPVPEAHHPTLDEPDPIRDHMEKRLYEHAVLLDMPVLGICRGVQVMNWAMGGDLYQDIDSMLDPVGFAKQHRQTAYGKARHDIGHYVRLVPGTLLARILGTDDLPVNTIHHQAVRKVAPALTVNAVSVDDNLVEGLELPGSRFCLGVQWHPECLWDRPATAVEKRLFEAFADAVRGGTV